jgi:AraC-like DNA-binding protein
VIALTQTWSILSKAVLELNDSVRCSGRGLLGWGTDTAGAKGAPVIAHAGAEHPERIELSCGAHVALRSTRFCAVWRFEPRANPTECAGEKTFLMNSIGYQMKGGWTFHGKEAPALVDAGTVIAGSVGQHFGCRHSASACDSVCAVSLLPGALDETDRTIFHKQILAGRRLPDLKRSLAIDDDERFESLIFEMFDDVSRASLGETKAPRNVAFRVQRMKRFIERHACESITLSDIARCLDMSPFTCIRQFKSGTGITPLRYLSRLRLKRAQGLLKNPRLTIAEVGRQVGILDRYYFTRWFSKEAGVPPQRFRQIVDP